MSRVVVFDFETSGLKPEYGARVIEAGAVLLAGGEIGARFQSLVNPGRPPSRFIQELTGISAAMLRGAPKPAEIFPQFLAFVGDLPLVAHNIRFDLGFLQAELQRLHLACDNPHACSLALGRRILPDAPRHSLSILAEHCGVTPDGPDGRWHRALADAEAAAKIWLFMEEKLKREYGLAEVSFELMRELCALRRGRIPARLRREAESQRNAPPA